MTAAEEITLEVEGLRIAGKAWGPAGGEPWLAVHGWLDNAGSFDLLAPLLAQGGRRVVAIDLPGHGRSHWRPPSAAYHFMDWIPAVFGVAQALGWDTFGYIGHSLGAGVGAMAAGALPERIRRLVLIEGLGPLVSAEEDAPLNMAAHLQQRLAQPKQSKPLLPYPSRLEAAKRLAGAVPGLTTAAARLLVERGTREVEGGVSWVTDPRLRHTSPHRFTEGQVLAYLRRILAPVLLVVGESGWTFPEEIMAQRRAAIADCTLERLPGGHHVHLDEAPRLAALIGQWCIGQ